MNIKRLKNVDETKKIQITNNFIGMSNDRKVMVKVRKIF